MVTIAVPNLGIFEGEDERAAMALVRKAKSKERRRKADQERAFSRAHERAAERGFFILDNCWRALRGGTKLSRSWILVDPHVKGTGVTVRERSTDFWTSKGHIATYEGVEYDHCGTYVTDVLVDGCGWVVAVICRPSDAADDSHDYVAVVGIADGAVSLRAMGISASDLRSLISEPRLTCED